MTSYSSATRFAGPSQTWREQFLGITGVGRYASGSPGLLVLPGYIGGEGMTNFYMACVGTVIAMVVSFVATYILFGVYEKKGKLDPVETGKPIQAVSKEAKKPIAPHTDSEIAAPVNGKLIPASEIKAVTVISSYLDTKLNIKRSATRNGCAFCACKEGR